MARSSTTPHSDRNFGSALTLPSAQSPQRSDQNRPDDLGVLEERRESGASRLRGGFRGLWNRGVSLFARRFVEGILLRRQAERFYLVFGGHLFFQTLRAAVEFDLFSLLAQSPGLDRSGIAERLGIAEQPARIMLLGLTASGFLRKRGERYFNTWLTTDLLTKESPRNVLSYVRLQHHVMYRGMPHFYESIRQYRNVGLAEFEGDERTLYERLAHDPEVEQVFQDAMADLSVQTNAMLAEFVDLSDVRSLVDVGGGDATNIITLAKRFPRLKACVFDFPSVCEIARKKIRSSGLADRLDAVPGNAFEDDFPRGADCFLFAHFFTIWSKEKDRLLLKKSYDALNPGGKVIVFNMMQHDDETGPLSAAVGSPYFLTIATGEGMLYTWREYEQWMREAGFVRVQRHVLPRDHGAIVGVKP